MITFDLPLKTVSEANAHEHWRKRQRRAKHQRSTAKLVASAHGYVGPNTRFPLVVLLTRVSPRQLDSDNLQGALKHVRDGIADWLGVDDRKHEVVAYEYAQEKGKVPAVRVLVQSQEAKTG